MKAMKRKASRSKAKQVAAPTPAPARRVTPSEQVIVLREHLAVTASHVRRLLATQERLHAALENSRIVIARLKAQAETRISGDTKPVEVVWPRQ
jgi:hypothetical protein